MARLLIGDEEIIAGGVETIRRGLLPGLAGQSERFVWTVPDFLVEDFWASTPLPAGACVCGLLPERGTWLRLAAAVLHRLRRVLPETLVVKANAAVRDLRYAKLAREERLDHFLTICAHRQLPPKLAMTVSAIVCDVSPDLPEAVRENILDWVTAADYVACISNFTREQVLARRPEAAEKVEALLLPVEPANAETRRQATTDARLIYYPAVAHPRKEHRVFFQACLELIRRGVEVRCVLTGDGTDGFAADMQMSSERMEPAREFFRAHLAELGPRITGRGRVSHEEREKLFATAGCVALPSHYEGFGLPLSEALAWGRPIISSDIAPFREQIDFYRASDRVAMFPAGDAEALANRLEAQLRAPVAAEDHEKARERVGAWTWEGFARRLLKGMEAAAQRRNEKVAEK